MLPDAEMMIDMIDMIGDDMRPSPRNDSTRLSVPTSTTSLHGLMSSVCFCFLVFMMSWRLCEECQPVCREAKHQLSSEDDTVNLRGDTRKGSQDAS